MTKTEKPKATLPRTIVEALPSSANMAKSVDQLGDGLAKLIKELDAACIKGAVPAAQAYVALHRLHDKIDAFCKMFDAFYSIAKGQRLPEVIEASGQDFIPLKEGFRVGVSHVYRASIREGKKDDAFVWLANHHLGDLITSTVNASTLSAAAKHMIEDENKDLPPDLFNVAQMPITSVTATK